jgi:serine protease AprX
MAAAVVSGGAALLIQEHPAFTPNQVKAQLMKTAYKNLPSYSTVTDAGVTYTLQYDAFTIGAGYLDLQAAISTTDIPPTTLSALSDCDARCYLRLRLFCTGWFYAWWR